jgi:hypothetical protein
MGMVRGVVGQLFDPGPPSDASLTDRQHRALELVRQTVGGVSEAEVGRDLHRWRESDCSCARGLPCFWAKGDGRQALAWLRAQGYGLVKRRETRLWVIPGVTPKPGEQGPGDLPEGF